MIVKKHFVSIRLLALCVCSAALLGCHKYVPATAASVPVGSDVRAILSAETQLDLRDQLGFDIGDLEGTLLEKNGDSLLVSVRLGSGSRVFGSQPFHQRIGVPHAGIARFEVKEVDPLRTVGLIGLFGGAASFGIAQLFITREPGNETPEPRPPDEHIRGAALLRVKIITW